MALAKSLENLPSLLSAPAAEFGNRYWHRQTIYDIRSVAAQQALVRTSEAVFGQVADHFEQRRADIVIQVFREQLFLPRLGEAEANVSGEFITQIGRDGVHEHWK
jgi:hypothetical protein